MHSRTKRTLSAARIAAFMLSIGIAAVPFTNLLAPSDAYAQSAPFAYGFDTAGTLNESDTPATSGSVYFWLGGGGKLVIADGVASSLRGDLSPSDPWFTRYLAKLPTVSDAGSHPQNAFKLFTRSSWLNSSATVYINRKADNLSNPANRHPFSGESMIARYVDDKNFYYAGIRADGMVVIKKQTNGAYQTLASKQLFPGTYNSATAYDLLPLTKWIGLKFIVADTASGPKLTVFTDIGKTGSWTLALSALDDASQFGAPIAKAGLVGIQSDFADIQLDNFVVSEATGTTAPVSEPTTSPVSSSPAPSTTSYDSTVLKDSPVLYLAMNGSGTESDKSGHGHTGTYKGTPSSSTMPNGDKVSVFDGSSQYLSVPSSSDLSISTTKQLTWEAWVRPDTLQFSNASSDGYIDWMGKCEEYSPSCEWEARMYSSSNAENRPSRMSGYVFNSSAGLGSAADWQPATGMIQAGKWLHVVAEYDLTSTPSGCSSSYPGQINIWVNGVKWDMSNHLPTGCMSQYSVRPSANSSALNIGTMALDTWFKGAIGKVAVYNHLLTQAQISNHYKAMTGKTPSGSCGSTCTLTY